MNFIKHRWVTGELVTANLLNRIENAIDYLFKNGQEIATTQDCDSLFTDFLKDD